MNKRENIKTTKEEIINYWKTKPEFKYINWEVANKTCWRCGIETTLQICHIVPYALNGLDTPSNYVLLCGRCHSEGPNIIDPEIMIDWINSTKHYRGNSFWHNIAIEEYKRVYGMDFMDQIEIISKIKGIDAKKLLKESQVYTNNFNEIMTNHYSQNYNNTMTIMGLYRMVVKEIAKKYDIDFTLISNDFLPFIKN